LKRLVNTLRKARTRENIKKSSIHHSVSISWRTLLATPYLPDIMALTLPNHRTKNLLQGTYFANPPNKKRDSTKDSCNKPQ